MKKINVKTAIFILISIILFIIPFFWLKPGEMDLGGDGNRLYFYDPLSNLKALAIYSITPWGIGEVAYNQYFLPYLFFIAFLKSIFSSPTVLIAIFNGLKLSGSFIFVFLVIKELFKTEEGKEITLAQFSAALLGAFFYTFSPSVIENMRYALFTHQQIFLNPMIFYLLLRFLASSSIKYIWLALLVTFIFSTNFSLQAPPPLFAFYPLAIIFLLSYNFFVLKKSFPWKGTVIGILFFFGLHAFHIIPVASNIFDRGSEFNTRIFESKTEINAGLEYFNATLPLGKVSRNILLPLERPMFSWSLLFIPLLIILGFLSMHKKNKTLFLISIFFFITLFLGSANITELGVEFYRKLFLVPGFGMFRNFSGQWQWVYTFFYAILAGIAIFYLFAKLKRKYVYIIIIIITTGFLLARSSIVFNGDVVNVFNRGSKNLKVVMKMDPHYEQLLAYLKKIPNDGKIFHVPFTDYAYNLVGGSNGGVYVGQSMVSLLAGRNDFSGYQDVDPFSEVLVEISREKNYGLIKQMMSFLQVRYVLYNSDPLISSEFFPTFPYGYTGIPASPSGALDFVHNISHRKVYEIGHYSLFEADKERYLPHFYIASDLLFYDTEPKNNTQYFKALSFFPSQQNTDSDPRMAYIDRQACSEILSKDVCSKNSHKQNNENIQIIFQKINPTKYRVEIKNATKPFLLVFQNSFTPKWKLYKDEQSINQKDNSESYYNGGIVELNPVSSPLDQNPFQTNSLKSVYGDTHIEVNGYANAWYIDASNLKKQDYKFIAEMDGQKIFYYSLAVSGVTLLIFLLYGIKLLRK